jgi:hypothetical protein
LLNGRYRQWSGERVLQMMDRRGKRAWLQPEKRESACGPSRHFAAAQQFRRFWREADIDWQARSTGSVENDPKASGGLLDDFIHECEHRGRDAEPRALAVASGHKDVAFRQQLQQM